MLVKEYIKSILLTLKMRVGKWLDGVQKLQLSIPRIKIKVSILHLWYNVLVKYSPNHGLLVLSLFHEVTFL